MFLHVYHKLSVLKLPLFFLPLHNGKKSTKKQHLYIHLLKTLFSQYRKGVGFGSILIVVIDFQR